MVAEVERGRGRGSHGPSLRSGAATPRRFGLRRADRKVVEKLVKSGQKVVKSGQKWSNAGQKLVKSWSKAGQKAGQKSGKNLVKNLVKKWPKGPRCCSPDIKWSKAATPPRFGLRRAGPGAAWSRRRVVEHGQSRQVVKIRPSDRKRPNRSPDGKRPKRSAKGEHGRPTASAARSPPPLAQSRRQAPARGGRAGRSRPAGGRFSPLRPRARLMAGRIG